jgi:DNA polymerase-3 subunit gamma/tau
MSLYQKYRPQEFDSISGQLHIKKSLQAALKRDMVAHAYLFCGPRGTGKTTTARLIAKSLNCPDFNKELLEPCNKCNICEAISSSALIDVIEIDAASNRGIDEIRELKETIRFAPTIAKNKIYIIDEVHMLTNEAFNALLKTLEEPPSNVFFVLATTEVHKIPETIISRCQRFDFRRISKNDLIERLKFIAETENIKYEIEALEMISIYSDGGLRDAISILDQLSCVDSISVENTKKLLGSTGIDTIYKFLDYLFTENDFEAHKIVKELHEEGFDIKQFQNDLLKICREKLHLAIEQNNTTEKIKLIELITLWQDINVKYQNSPIPELSIEVLIVRFCKKADFAQEAQRIEKTAEKAVEKISTSKPVIDKPVAAKPVTAKSVPIKTVELKNVPVEDKPAIQDTVDEVAINPEPLPKAVVFDENLDLEKDWKKLTENIVAPALRMTLKHTICRRVSDSEAELYVSSNFDYERIKTAENIHLVEKMILEFTGLKIMFRVVKDLVDINKINKASKSTAAPKNDFGNFTDLDMFEGEFIDD